MEVTAVIATKSVPGLFLLFVHLIYAEESPVVYDYIKWK